jgi:cytochrome c-type biogenesis protein
MLMPALERALHVWMLPIASQRQRRNRAAVRRSLGSALLLGAVLGLVWSPCSGPLLASALTLVASEGGAARGGWVWCLGRCSASARRSRWWRWPMPRVPGFTRARGWVLGHIDAPQEGARYGNPAQ